MKNPILALAPVIAAGILMASSAAHAAVLASYEFTGANSAARAAATSSASDVTASSFAIRSELGTGSSLAGFSSAGNIFSRVNGTTASGLAEAITETQYVTVTISPDSGFQFNLTNLTVDLGYSMAVTPVGQDLNLSVFSSVDGFTAPDVLATQNFTAADTTGEPGSVLYQNVDIDLSGVAYQGLTDPLEFRIYLYDNEDALTQPIYRIDNFTLNGAVAAVPEPSAALLGALGLLALLRRRR